MNVEDRPETPGPTPPEGAGIEQRQVIHGPRPGDQIVRIVRPRAFRMRGPGLIEARPEAGEPKTAIGRAVVRLERFLLGSPIPTTAEGTERVGVRQGLAIFASDNISSSAYATEEILRVLVIAGAAALAFTMPLTFAIVAILAIVVFSDRLVIQAYPNGGGSYIVARENLGPLPGVVAAGALLIDYVLTAAVSISAGVTAITSAFPELHPLRVNIAVLVMALMAIVNIRGIRESGRLFTIPVYLYLGAVLGLVAIGTARAFTGELPPYSPPADWLAAHQAAPLTLLLLLRAFASGSVALTGTEAISNGVPAFKPPEVRNARLALVSMGALFGTIFVGLSFLASRIGIVPDPAEVETVLSQLARTLTGEGWYYYFLQFSTALLLVLAANTAFNGFPRLAGILGQDQFLPHYFAFRGDRLAYNTGILALAVVASALIWLYQASVTGLIPLYTIGVFIAFTLSQTGLMRRWLRLRQTETAWRARLIINAVGAAATGTVAVVVAVSKFALGAWMVLIVLPVLVAVMWSVYRHYARLQSAVVPETPLDPAAIRLRLIVPVADTSLQARQALAYAMAIVPPDRILAVHVISSEESAENFSRAWQDAQIKVPLVMIESPFRSFTGPLIEYVDAVREAHPNDILNVIVPEFVPRHWWEHLIHTQSALRLKAALLFHPGIVVTSVPYHLGE